MDLSSKTVLELRKLAREHGVKLSAGVNKSEMIQRIQAKFDEEEHASSLPEASDPVMTSFDETQGTDPSSVIESEPQEPEKEALSDAGMDTAEEAVDASVSEPFDALSDDVFRAPEEDQPPLRHPIDSDFEDIEEDAFSGETDEDEEASDHPEDQNSSPDTEAELKDLHHDDSEDADDIDNGDDKGTPRPFQPIPNRIPIPGNVPQVPGRPAGVPYGQNTPPTQPHYRSSWHNTSPSAQTKFNNASRSGGSASSRSTDTGRPAFGPRFGPNSFGPQAGQDSTSNTSTDDTQGRSFGPGARNYDQRSGYASRPNTPVRNYGSTYGSRNYGADTSSPRREAPPDLPSIQDLISPVDCEQATGVLEVLPDGYGFLRSDSLLPSTHDIYVPAALVRRYEMRTGDQITGRIRPQRDGDKYNALLYITQINGTDVEHMEARKHFDDLTPVYSTRRLILDSARHPDIRLVDLIAPMGLGSRTLMLFPPDCSKRMFLTHLANAILAKNENMDVVMLLMDFTPEDVTAIRDEVSCPVLATTFDMTPEIQMRLIDLAQERAHRLTENGRDVVLIVDSLTRLVRTFAAASPQGRQSGGVVNSAALFRAKKLFGAARCAREGGSLTVLATMDIENGQKVDDAIVEEFRANANTEIVMDVGIARLNMYPPVHYSRTRSHRPELLLDEKELEGLVALREILAGGSPANAVEQMLGLIEKVGSNEDILQKIKSWSALMSGASR